MKKLLFSTASNFWSYKLPVVSRSTKYSKYRSLKHSSHWAEVKRFCKEVQEDRVLRFYGQMKREWLLMEQMDKPALGSLMDAGHHFKLDPSWVEDGCRHYGGAWCSFYGCKWTKSTPKPAASFWMMLSLSSWTGGTETLHLSRGPQSLDWTGVHYMFCLSGSLWRTVLWKFQLYRSSLQVHVPRDWSYCMFIIHLLKIYK